MKGPTDPSVGGGGEEAAINIGGGGIGPFTELWRPRCTEIETGRCAGAVTDESQRIARRPISTPNKNEHARGSCIDERAADDGLQYNCISGMRDCDVGSLRPRGRFSRLVFSAALRYERGLEPGANTLRH